MKRDRISQRLVGAFGFSDAGRSIDGAQYSLAKDGTNVTVIGGRPTQGVFQVDGWGELNINLLYGAVTRQTGSERAPGELRIFGLAYDDYRHGVVKADNRPTATRAAEGDSIVVGTFGAHYLQKVGTAAGPVDVLVWAGRSGRIVGNPGASFDRSGRGGRMAAGRSGEHASLGTRRLRLRGG